MKDEKRLKSPAVLVRSNLKGLERGKEDTRMVGIGVDGSGRSVGMTDKDGAWVLGNGGNVYFG